MSTPTTYTVGFPFCGLGALALGFLQARAKLCGLDATFVSVGGIDSDAAACRDFEYLTGTPALCRDVAGMTPTDLRAFWPECPDVVISSPPCKANSGLMSSARAKTAKYQALNQLALQWLDLLFDSYDERPKLVLVENVPGILSRGKALLAEIKRRLASEGYVFDEGTHECGELGGLAQLRRRYLLVARRKATVPPLLYKPPKLRVRGCGEVIEALPLPNDTEAGGRLHVMPRLSWLNWIRLALIPAGGDWRDLPGVLEEGASRRSKFGRYRIDSWTAPTQTVDGPGTNGCYGVADPRVPPKARNGQYGVTGWDEPSATVTGSARVDNGPFSVADPRLRPQADNPNMHVGKYRVRGWDDPSLTVTGSGARVGSGAQSVADPRVKRAFDHGYRVLRWDEPSFTVHTKTHPGNGAYTVADPRTDAAARFFGDDGAEVVVDDLRERPKLVPVLLAADNTWHRPFTPLELAVLQGLPTHVGGRPLDLSGRARDKWCERIGNAVPVGTAKAIATQMLVTLVHASVEQFALGSTEIWVDRAPPALAVEPRPLC
ncbi:MAG: DNA cytosine methyltransferase [Gammaproteobacteria bacterium]|nr:DNA cytosine methyltransferase [Gammaproteobacteria bacterium]NIR82368.1 DNA cytosine methyltransferase [Gammaproteobacteria bacterium]NIU03513.1 DNA cytosine methyltransferase [Gammaproteobacteria bacterium]NIX84787.1 DNA cytosine methyltransferase [Gammaproteobacteria bacterium]